MSITFLQFYKFLADETRLKALLLIQEQRELCVCELVEALAVSQPKISRHLAHMRKGELLCDRREGQWVYYRINPALPDWAIEVLALTLAGDEDCIATSRLRLDSMDNRPARSCCT